MSSALEVYSDLSEKLHYNFPDFPLYARKGTLRQFNRYAAACHWHAELEFVSVLEGEMEYFVNGSTVHLDRGDGIFVNSKRLHYGFSGDGTDCSYLVVAVHPALLGESTRAGKAYLQEKFGLGAEDCLLLQTQCSWQEEALISLRRIYDEMCGPADNPLRLIARAASLCAGIGDHIRRTPVGSADGQSWEALWKMTEFIHRNYDRKITLDEIAVAGAACRSRCCKLFGRYVGRTPGAYLTQYRIQKSCEMLRETNRSVCEIALSCGFQSASYFSYVFRMEMGAVPQEYRRCAAVSHEGGTP